MRNPLETMDNFYKRQALKPDFMLNGGFYNWGDGSPALTFKENGVYIRKESMWVGMGILNNRLYYGDTNKFNFSHFISGYPTLVEDSRIKIGARPDTWRDMRSAIGYNGEYYFLLVTDARQPQKYGMTFEELAQAMLDIGCWFAIALDGGGSSKLTQNNIPLNSPIENRTIDNAVCVYLKKETPMGTLTTLKINEAFSIQVNQEIPLNAKVAPNFQFSELRDPTTNRLMIHTILLAIIQALRTEQGWSINVESCYRGEPFNTDVGGAWDSYHKTGEAIDFKAYLNGKQIDTIHAGYQLQYLLNRFGIKGGIGVYMPNYEKGSMGFNHLDVRMDKPRSLWVCYKKPTLISISNLSEIKI